jgi:hypothetical protein
VLNIILIPVFGTAELHGDRDCIRSVSGYSLMKLWSGGWVVSFPRGRDLKPDWAIIRSLFRFGLPTGIQGIAMNIGGVLMLSFMGSLVQSAAAQAAYAVSYTQLFSLITWPPWDSWAPLRRLPDKISVRANRNARTRPFTSQPDSG